MNNTLTVLRQHNKETNRKISCAEALVESLENLGTEIIFGYPGASVLSVYDALSKSGKIKHYLVRHEQAALHAAEGYARVCGKTGVAIVTSGPGFTNTITGIANAYSDSTPLVVLAGDVSTTNKNGKIFQNVNIESMCESCTKKVFSLTKNDNIKNIIEQAFIEANSGVKGPVVVVLPRNILETEYNKRKNYIGSQSITYNDHKNGIKYLQELLSKAKMPLILIGGGCINSAKEVKDFIKKINCPVVSTLMGIGIFPSENDSYLGMIGINGVYTANSAINSCDLLIALGVSFSDRTTCKNLDFIKNKKIVSVNIQDISGDMELRIKSDTKEFLLDFISKVKTNYKFDNWIHRLNIIKSECADSDDIGSMSVLKTISDYTSNYNPIVVTDVGLHQMLTAQFFNFNEPRKFITSGGLGTMGFGLPASIGAHIAKPDNLILNITGDGSFQMNLQELATCREHNIPIKIIILNNGSLGMVRQLQEKIYNKEFEVKMTNPDFTKIAEAYDLFAVRVSKKSELIPALKNAISHDGTAIIDIMINNFHK